VGDDGQELVAVDDDGSPIDHGPFQAGDTIAGKYRVDRVVGIGGMGQVVAATHVDLGQEVAIKILLRSRAKDAEAVERFLREAHAAVRLKSTHVARVFDVGTTDDGLPYIVMELLDGQDLCDVIERMGALSYPDAVDFILQACDAVAEAHARGIVHRDIKPENLFLTSRRDGTPCIKVLDFGISKLGATSAPRKGRRAITQDDVVMGSPAYMSPEQVKSSAKADHRSDIWSLGVTLYELLTGREPFVGESTPDIFVSILTTEPAPVAAVVPGIPPELSAVVMRCLVKDVTQRYQDVESLAQALLPFTTRKPTSVAPSWTNTSPEFRVPGLPPASAPGIPVAPSSGSLPHAMIQMGDAVPPSSRNFTPHSAGPAALSSTIMERKAAKPSRSLWAYGLAGAAAAIVAGGVLAGVAYQRARVARAAAPPLEASALPIPEPVPQPQPEATLATSEPTASTEPVASSATTSAAPKPSATATATTKVVFPRPLPPMSTATPKASALPRHRTAW
jgi:serine/threonine protein kinase